MTEEIIVVSTSEVVVWTGPGWYVAEAKCLKDTRKPRELLRYFNFDKFKRVASPEECGEDGQMINRPGFTINDAWCNTNTPEWFRPVWLSEKPEVVHIDSDCDFFEACLVEHQEFMQAYADCEWYW